MKKIFITIVTMISLLLSLTSVLACEENETGMQRMMGIAGGGMMYGVYGGYGTNVMLFSWITWFLIVILIIAAIYWLIKSANKK